MCLDIIVLEDHPMGDNRNLCPGNPSSQSRETICIDTYRVLDSCRDRDCYDDVRVYLTEAGQAAAENGTLRATAAEILWSYITVDPVMFTCGFFRVTVKSYVLLTLEACIGTPRVRQEYNGLALLEKDVVLYGGTGNTTSFRSDPEAGPCDTFVGAQGSNLPIAVMESVPPFVMSLDLRSEPCECTCTCGDSEGGNTRSCSNAILRNEDLPDFIRERLINPIVEEPDCFLVATIGMFSVIRIQRPTQILVQASDYSVPDKECRTPGKNNPCRSFRDIPFPIEEFSISGNESRIGQGVGRQSSCNSQNNSQAQQGSSCSCRNR